MKLTIRAVTLGNAMQTAAAQYRTDEKNARAAGQLRTADAFAIQARECEWLASEMQPESGDVIIDTQVPDGNGHAPRSVEREARRG